MWGIWKIEIYSNFQSQIYSECCIVVKDISEEKKKSVPELKVFVLSLKKPLYKVNFGSFPD